MGCTYPRWASGLVGPGLPSGVNLSSRGPPQADQAFCCRLCSRRRVHGPGARVVVSLGAGEPTMLYQLYHDIPNSNGSFSLWKSNICWFWVALCTMLYSLAHFQTHQFPKPLFRTSVSPRVIGTPRVGPWSSPRVATRGSPLSPLKPPFFSLANCRCALLPWISRISRINLSWPSPGTVGSTGLTPRVLFQPWVSPRVPALGHSICAASRPPPPVLSPYRRR